MDSFECAVCLQQFNDPRVISCGHTFCKGCLQKLKPNQLLCPLCRHSFESVDSLPSNFVVLKWMDENKNQTTKKQDIQCDNCEEGKLAVVWCEKCEINYCKDCDTTLHTTKALRNHLRISLKEKSKKASFTKCKNHMRDNEVYCIDCKSLICTICVLDYHQQHKAQSVSKCAEEKRVELKSCVAPFQNLEPLMKMNQEFKLVKEKYVAELKSIETRAQVLKNQILQCDRNIQQISTRTEKVKTSEIVLMNSIQEMRDMDLLENKNIEQMKRKIQDVLNEVYPEGDKERLEKERLEKERLEKERLEKERLEKERLKKERLKGTKVPSKLICLSSFSGLWSFGRIDNVHSFPLKESNINVAAQIILMVPQGHNTVSSPSECNGLYSFPESSDPSLIFKLAEPCYLSKVLFFTSRVDEPCTVSILTTKGSAWIQIGSGNLVGNGEVEITCQYEIQMNVLKIQKTGKKQLSIHNVRLFY